MIILCLLSLVYVGFCLFLKDDAMGCMATIVIALALYLNSKWMNFQSNWMPVLITIQISICGFAALFARDLSKKMIEERKNKKDQNPLIATISNQTDFDAFINYPSEDREDRGERWKLIVEAERKSRDKTDFDKFIDSEGADGRA